MNSEVYEEIMQNHNQAEAFISLFFAGLDVITYIVILTLFGFEFKSLDSPKQKLTMFLLLDGILRIINMYTDSYMQSFVREMVLSLIVTLQFYLSISMLEQIFTDKSNESFLVNELQIKNKYLFSFIFFCLVFSLKGLMTSNFLSSIQYICILILISVFYKYIANKIDLFLTNISKKNNQFQGRNFINNLPFFVFLYFTIFYILQLCGLMIDNKLYESYMTMICTIFKEVGKYLNILLLIAIYHSFNKYIKDNEFVYETKPIQKDNKVQVYKDDEVEEIN
jgi:hypothetical protein